MLVCNKKTWIKGPMLHWSIGGYIRTVSAPFPLSAFIRNPSKSLSANQKRGWASWCYTFFTYRNQCLYCIGLYYKNLPLDYIGPLIQAHDHMNYKSVFFDYSLWLKCEQTNNFEIQNSLQQKMQLDVEIRFNLSWKLNLSFHYKPVATWFISIQPV